MMKLKKMTPIKIANKNFILFILKPPFIEKRDRVRVPCP
jgi:hypothetical protein